MRGLCSSLLLSLVVASSASALTMAWTPIGNPGNACDPQSLGCFGGVMYSYAIGTYEVTNAQYVEFLNAKAGSDPLGLYNESMIFVTSAINRSGSSGSYSYNAVAGSESHPVSFVSLWDAMRFANWLNNGQGSGDTETGAYNLFGGTPTPTNRFLNRNLFFGATIVLPLEREWYKAAYYDASSASYFDYPAGSNTPITCSAPSAAANRANCSPAPNYSTPVGSYPGSPSPYGTFDQGGNIHEWTETGIGTPRVIRGGSFINDQSVLAADTRSIADPSYEAFSLGFRLAMIPEPGTGLLVSAGLLGLAGWRRGRD